MNTGIQHNDASRGGIFLMGLITGGVRGAREVEQFAIASKTDPGAARS